MVYQRGSALALLVLCGSLACVMGQLPPGVIPIPDDTAPVAAARPAMSLLQAPVTSAIAAPAAGAAVPAKPAPGAAAALPAAGVAPGFPAAAGAGAFPAAQPGFGAVAQPGFGAVVPSAAAPALASAGAFPAQPGFAATAQPVPPALPAAFPAQPGFGAPAAAFPGFPGAGAAAIPVGGAAALPGAMPTGLPGAMPGFPGAMPGLPGALPGFAADPRLGLPPGLISNPLAAVPAPPPRARPAAPPAPPIPAGRQPWKPQWDELKDFTDNEVIISFNVANTPEQIYWNQKKVREALAKAGGILPNSISYYQVLPSTDDFGRPFTTIRFVVQNRNADLASNLMTSLNNEATQNKLKNRIEELNLDLIGDSMKAQTPTDYKATSRGGASTSAALPSSSRMDETGGMNGAGALAAGGGPGAAMPLGPGPGMGAGPGGPGGLGAEPAGGNATSTAGLPGMGAGGGSSMRPRRQASAAQGATSSWLLAAAGVAAAAMLL